MGDIWVHDLLLGTESRLTFDAAGDWWPIWSPDGLRVTFGSRRSGTDSLYWKRADGSGQAETLFEGTGAEIWPGAWSPDGSRLAFHSGLPNADIWTLPFDDGQNAGEPGVFLATGSIERGVGLSPDGRWVAYYSDQSGHFEVYVRPYPDGEGQWLVSTEGGVNPQWSRDSGELFYRNGNQMMVLNYEGSGDTFVRGRPESLFEVPTPEDVLAATFDVTADGQRFFVLLPVESREVQRTHLTDLTLVTNWFDEVRRSIPTGH